MPINVNKHLRRAATLARQGEADAAARLYTEVLAQFPGNRNAKAGLAALGRAPEDVSGDSAPQQQIVELIQLYNAGHARRVLEQGRLLVGRYPADAVLHNLLGAASMSLGAHEGAVASFQEAIRLQPGNAETCSNLGAVFNTLGRQDEAIAAYRRALELAPANAGAHYNLGNALRDSGRLEDAAASYARAIEYSPENPGAWNNLGNVLSKLERYPEAIDRFNKAIEQAPGFASAHNNLGNTRYLLGQLDEAIASHREAVRLQPDFAAAYCNLGKDLRAAGSLDEALSSLLEAVRLQPDYVDAHFCLGQLYQELRRHQEAAASYAEALQLQPEHTLARANMLGQLGAMCAWSAIDDQADSIPRLGLAGAAVQPFALLALDDDAANQLQRARQFAAETYHLEPLPPIPAPATPPDQLRVGYFSADFHNHATMVLMARLFEVHDRDRVIVHAFSYGPERDDDMRRRLRAAVDHFHDISNIDDRRAAELARAEGIDIAVDLKGYTYDNRTGIFAFRAAPVQMSYLGYPGTLGAPFIDYLVADPVVVPPAHRQYYSEDIIYLPDSYQVNDDTRAVAAESPTRKQFGLPDDAFVFCCFNGNYKIGADEFDIWMRLLQQVEGSVLWLLASNPWSVENLALEAEKRGVSRQRIVFAEGLKPAEHLARHALADLFLDTFRVNAHTTASDALWAGLPVLTVPGECFASRVGASLLTAVGLPELIARSRLEYEQRALELARSPAVLAGLRGRLEVSRHESPLFATRRFSGHLEAAYRQAYQRFLEGKPPGTIAVEPGE